MSVGVGNSAAMVPLPVGEPAWRSYITKLEAQTKNLASYLPDSYTKTEIAGYKAQHKITTERFASNHSAVMEIPYSAGSTIVVLIEKPLSRGVVGINTTDIYAEPFIDFHTLQNPVDVDMVISMIRLLRRYIATSTIQTAFHPIEVTPGLNVTSPEDLITYIRNRISSSTAHGSCTAAMMPRELGGVVDPDLLVYGVTGLSVADASIMPMVPATHLCATVYATAEKVNVIFINS
jgi:choline dehydrogenase-like flavoprotein